MTIEVLYLAVLSPIIAITIKEKIVAKKWLQKWLLLSLRLKEDLTVKVLYLGLRLRDLTIKVSI